MGKKILLLLAVATVAMVMIPATASAGLVNEYGMHFAGQKACVDCHAFFGGTTTNTTHSRMAKQGLIPDAPEGWDAFQSPGGVGDPFPILNTWITLGDYQGGLATEYLYWVGAGGTKGMPWNLVEGLGYETPEGKWVLESDEPDGGLYAAAYGCQRCHQLGTTYEIKTSPVVQTVPNPDAITIAPTTTTPRQWARPDGTKAADFMADATLSYPGMSIQCEACHGTGQGATAEEGGHTNTGVKVNTTLWGNTGLGQSQVCGQCHGSYTAVRDADGNDLTPGIYGFTPNVPMRDFVNVDGTPFKSGTKDPSAAPYTQIPTNDEFMASPTWYWMFPNGSNAKGGHFYYDEWAASAHSYRGAYYQPAGTLPADFSPDAMTYQRAGNGHYNATTQSTIDSGCYKCHTGEGYLYSKGTKLGEDLNPVLGNIGFMGQECVTCHNPHPWKGEAEGVAEDTIREPDKAGERSAAGLAVDNTSVCEDCHNWQKEVQGAAWTTTIKPQADLAGRGGPSHPQRETYHGRIMLDVPEAGQLMPGVKCEDCHMPKTNKAANRYSHGMKIMLPGKADEWMTAAGPSYQGEDSCSKCHGGETREELQVNVDKWQADTTAQAEETAAAIMDAQTRSEFSMTDANSPGYVLVGRATWNYRSWVNDGSTGAHNPEYIMDGLVKAEMMADSVGGRFKSLFWSNSVVPGGTGFVSGKVVDGNDTGDAGAAGASLVLYKNGVATNMETTADKMGNFAFMVTPDGSATYKVVWMRSADPKSNLPSSSMSVAVAKMASKTTLTTSASSILVNKSVKLSGKVTPSAAGQMVQIQYRRTTTASWKALGAPIALNSTSQYAKLKQLTSKGTWYFRTRYAGTATVASSTSATVKVIVR